MLHLEKGAMDEVEWLKTRLEHLESTILAQGPSTCESLGRPTSRRGRSGKEEKGDNYSNEVDASPRYFKNVRLVQRYGCFC